MQQHANHRSRTLALLCVGLLATSPVWADKPAWSGSAQKGKPERSERASQGDVDRRDRDGKAADEVRGRGRGNDGDLARNGGFFDESRQAAVREYYAERLRSGNCPPGLAKKQNGCLPPGQARKWALGQQLPRDVVFHDPPQAIRDSLGLPPRAHRYVRVNDDLLLINNATGLVVDAIQSMGGN
jgi:Ni/Co efflux regulator RcnB